MSDYHTASYNCPPTAIDAPLCTITDTDIGSIVNRTSDPRIYARAATLSTFTARYVMDDVKFSSCTAKEDLPDNLDEPIVKWQPFASVTECQNQMTKGADNCSWYAFGGDKSFVVDDDKAAKITANCGN